MKFCTKFEPKLEPKLGIFLRPCLRDTWTCGIFLPHMRSSPRPLHATIKQTKSDVHHGNKKRANCTSGTRWKTTEVSHTFPLQVSQSKTHLCTRNIMTEVGHTFPLQVSQSQTHLCTRSVMTEVSHTFPQHLRCKCPHRSTSVRKMMWQDQVRIKWHLTCPLQVST